MIDLRILFVAALIVTAALYYLADVGPGTVLKTLINALFLLSVLSTAIIFFSLLFRINPVPLLRETGYRLGLTHLVSFSNAIPVELNDTIAVDNISRIDTDDDGELEWVVFYEVDLNDGSRPVQGFIYDNDRGIPPVIYPYALRPYTRNYLGQKAGAFSGVTMDVREIDGLDAPELVVDSDFELTIFRFQQNSQAWEPPIDTPQNPRYFPIGAFQGTHSVRLENNNDVVTIDWDALEGVVSVSPEELPNRDRERSQLVRRTVYRLSDNNTYWRNPTSPTELVDPILQTIDFLPSPPNNIENSAFPEKVVLAFYATSCSQSDNSLCGNVNGVGPRDLLKPEGDETEQSPALVQHQNSNWGYFGLPAGTVDSLEVRRMNKLTPTLIEVTFLANGQLATRWVELEQFRNQWKIINFYETDPRTNVSPDTLLPPLGPPTTPQE